MDPASALADYASATGPLVIAYRAIGEVVPDPRNARTHSKRQIAQIAASIRSFGFTNPILADEQGGVIAGHGRLLAAKQLGLSEVPVIALIGLNDTQKRALRLADNKIALNAGWDVEILKLELAELSVPDIDLDLSLTGFSPGEIDVIVSGSPDPDDEVIPAMLEAPRARLGDIWQLGEHRVGCGDGRDLAFLRAVVGEGRVVDAAFLDPPYNVKINGHANARGRHRAFAMASGEMTTAAFRTFLTETLSACERVSRNGAVHFVCMDWRHLDDLSVVGDTIYNALLNICVWNKSKRRDGLALTLQTRAGLRLPGGRCAAHQYGRTWQAWPQSHQRLGLCFGQLAAGQSPRRP